MPFPQILCDTEPMVRFTKLKKIMLNIVHFRNAVFKCIDEKEAIDGKKLPDLTAAWSITTMFNEVVNSAYCAADLFNFGITSFMGEGGGDTSARVLCLNLMQGRSSTPHPYVQSCF